MSSDYKDIAGAKLKKHKIPYLIRRVDEKKN